MKFKLIFFLFLVTCSLLLIYSFSQVDLNLTLSSNSAYQSFQKTLTNLGYFNRPLSTTIYIVLISLLSISYFFILNSKFSIRQLWLLILLAVVILLPSYPAFSHDIFNYLFDARIVTKYGLSPWHYKALDFPADTWIRFMRWTHRSSVYPPIWIGLSLIPSWLGMGKFILTLGLFKTIISAAYLGCCKLIYKLKPPALVLFAFNPLVIVEALVNGHMEFVMISFGLLSLYSNRKIFRGLWYLASVGIKFMTGYLLPAVLNPKHLRLSIQLGMILLVGWVIYYGFQPWYILWVFPFAVLLGWEKWETKLLTAASISSLFWNIPLVQSGDFNLPPWQSRILYVFIPLIVILITMSLRAKRSNLYH